MASIETALATLGRTTLLALLRPGLDPEVTESEMRRSGLRRSEAVESVYAWRNGTSIPNAPSLDAVQLIPGFYMLSLEDP